MHRNWCAAASIGDSGPCVWTTWSCDLGAPGTYCRIGFSGASCLPVPGGIGAMSRSGFDTSCRTSWPTIGFEMLLSFACPVHSGRGPDAMPVTLHSPAVSRTASAAPTTTTLLLTFPPALPVPASSRAPAQNSQRRCSHAL